MMGRTDEQGTLLAAGLPLDELDAWQASRPPLPATVAGPSDLAGAAQAAARYYARGDAVLRRLPPRPARSETETAAAETIKAALRETRTGFLRAYAGALYADLTADFRDFIRADELVFLAAERWPGLTPTRATVAREATRPLKEKEGDEIDQGLFLSAVLSLPRAGAHLLHAMLRPKPDSLARLDAFRRSGELDLGTVVLRRDGRAGLVVLRNTPFLNAEDDVTTAAMETAIDLALLDPAIEVGVLRGAPVEHPRYRGRRIFNAGLNLTHLSQGRLSFMFYITRDLGFVNKLYRGLTGPEFRPDEPETTLEKPWIAAVDAFAIGGGCQLLLVMDHVLAETGAFFNLPARKEGIIPGAANLRLTRFVGERLARQGLLFDRQFPVDSPEGRLLCDAVTPAGGLDAALARTIDSLTSSGVVSAASNRKALRAAHEPLATFQAYMALYAREQAYCHFSPALVRNLEMYWTSRRRATP